MSNRSRCSYKKSYCSDDDDNYLLKKDVRKLEIENLLLTERVDKLEKLVADMISYRPDGEGYQETKTHFETLK